MKNRHAVLGCTIVGIILATFAVGLAQKQEPARIYPQDDGFYNLMSLIATSGDNGQAKTKAVALNVHVPAIGSDPSVKYDYDIVMVRSPRLGDDKQTSWPDVSAPTKVEPGADMMLLHPDGREELLFKAGQQQAVADLYVSFDAKWVFFTLFDGIERRPVAASQGQTEAFAQSADIYKLNVKTRRVVRLTHQEYTPNTGIVDAAFRPSGIFNIGPCPLPGGRIMFTSDRNGFVPSKNSGRGDLKTHDFQLFSMDEEGNNVDLVGHLNLNSALHPVILRDGRVMFSSFESEGFRDFRNWAMWTIRPDGTHWFSIHPSLGPSGEVAHHFGTQLSDGHVIMEQYYFENNLGFGTYFEVPENVPEGQPYFASSSTGDPRNIGNPEAIIGRVPFTPLGLQEITSFVASGNGPARPSDPNDPKSPRDGKFTQPAGAPDNNLLTVYSPGPAYGISFRDPHHVFMPPAIHGGIYLLKGGKTIKEPSQLLLIKMDPDYNLQWPRPLVPYKRVYGVVEPASFPAPYTGYGANIAKELPKGAPYGIVGSASLYKRESYPGGKLNAGEVTSHYGGGFDPFRNLGGYTGGSRNWGIQGADAGKYDNSDIHAIRILIEEPLTDPDSTAEKTRRWWNATRERLRILGEIPVRKFNSGEQPVDPDGNPDTSFMVKIPANVVWTFQTLDKNGMVLNMAQTWHQIRPGEVRTDCGGCHAHSQPDTPWEKTAAAQPNYQLFDLTQHTSLITTKKNDESHKKWDVNDETGLRFQKNIEDVEYYRDIKPIFERSCVACHTKNSQKPAGNLVLDNDAITEVSGGGPMFGKVSYAVPKTFAELAAKRGGGQQGSRYVWFFQSRRSLLVWKIFGKRLDGFSNDDFAYETKPGDPDSLQYHGKPITKADLGGVEKIGPATSIAYLGTQMPPPEAVAGTYTTSDGQIIKVPGLSDEDRLKIVRWIDLGCPIDLDYDPARPQQRGLGWLADDSRPTLTVTTPAADVNPNLTRIVVGMYDYESGLDLNSFHVVANFDLDRVKAGTELAAKFKQRSPGIWEMTLAKPLTQVVNGRLVVSVKDKRGNVSEVDRTFSVSLAPPRKPKGTSVKTAANRPTAGHVQAELGQ